MAAVKSYRDLETWQKVMDLVQAIYAETKTFQKEETYGLSSQMRRAAVSIPSNIAEGQGRDSTKEFLHHSSIAYGSLCELETQMDVACRLGYFSQQVHDYLFDSSSRVGQLINGLSNSLRK